MNEALARKKDDLIKRIAACDRLLVALSGGVDSAVLLTVAVEALGRDRVLAVTGRSPAVTDAEIDVARGVAEQVGAPHEVVDTHELERPGYRANAGDRCWHCRTELFSVLRRHGAARGFASIAYGAIADDSRADRPGMRAADEAGILAPLSDAGLGKTEIRELARLSGLEIADKPANACLASRMPVGTQVTPERLAAVALAEAGLRELGFDPVRVRHHVEVARIELPHPREALRALADAEVMERVVAAVKAAGFRYASLDLEGYRPESTSLPRPTLYRIES